MSSISFQIYSNLSELRKLRKFAEDFYKEIVDDIELDRILLALEEAVSNVILHGYKNFEEGLIDVELSYDEKEISICVKDNANFFDGNKLKLEMDKMSQTPFTGLGIFLMKKLMNIEYKPRKEGGTVLYMKKINYLKKKS